mgnify:CR=1 FL=1
MLFRSQPYNKEDEEQKAPPLNANKRHNRMDNQRGRNSRTPAPSRRDPFKDYVIPLDKYKIIRKCHNTQVGHWKVQLTVNRVNKLLQEDPQYRDVIDTYTPAEVRRDVTAVINKCPCCQKMDPICKQIATRPYTTSSWGIFDNIAMDTIMGLPQSKQGHTNLLVIIDTFSRYIELFPMKELTAEATTKHLLSWMNRYGRPFNVLTDNASQFKHVFAATLQNLGIENSKIHPYSHQENSIVERANREVLRHLRNCLFDHRVLDDWDEFTSDVQRIKNASPHSSTGVSPAELVFGNSCRLDRHTYFIPPSRSTPQSIFEYLTKKRRQQELALTLAYEHNTQEDQQHIARASTAPVTEFPINSYVLVQYETTNNTPPTKLSPKLRGPYRIVNQVKRPQGDVYTCEELTTRKCYDFHVKLLVPYLFDSNHHDPIDAAVVDSQAFIVESVIDHKFEGRLPSKENLKFLIKWKGYPDSSNSWEPYNNVSTVGAVHQYLQQRKLRKYIPTQYK